MASANEPENTDPIWTTWRYGHDLAFEAMGLIIEGMAKSLEAEPPEERGDPVKVLRGLAAIVQIGKYGINERSHAMMPVDEAIAHALDDPRVLGALTEKFATGCLPPSSAAYALACLKEILLPPGDDDDD